MWCVFVCFRSHLIVLPSFRLAYTSKYLFTVLYKSDYTCRVVEPTRWDCSVSDLRALEVLTRIEHDRYHISPHPNDGHPTTMTINYKTFTLNFLISRPFMFKYPFALLHGYETKDLRGRGGGGQRDTKMHECIRALAVGWYVHFNRFPSRSQQLPAGCCEP